MRTVTRSRSRFSRPTCNYNENAPGARTFSSREELTVSRPDPEDRFIPERERKRESGRVIASLRNRSRGCTTSKKLPPFPDSVPIKRTWGQVSLEGPRKRIHVHVPFLPSFRSRRESFKTLESRIDGTVAFSKLHIYIYLYKFFERVLIRE